MDELRMLLRCTTCIHPKIKMRRHANASFEPDRQQASNTSIQYKSMQEDTLRSKPSMIHFSKITVAKYEHYLFPHSSIRTANFSTVSTSAELKLA